MNSQRISSLTPLADVLVRVAALARLVAPREVAVQDAEGRVLAEDVAVAAALPTGPVALVDGWAVRAELVADAGPYAPISLAAPAWVDAGAAMPRDTDAILPPDAVSGAEAHAAATAGDGGGDGIRCDRGPTCPRVLRQAGHAGGSGRSHGPAGHQPARSRSRHFHTRVARLRNDCMECQRQINVGA